MTKVYFVPQESTDDGGSEGQMIDQDDVQGQDIGPTELILVRLPEGK